MPKLQKLSGRKTLKILCNRFDFEITGRTGSHVRISKMTNKGKVGTVVPMHKELKTGTLKSILRLAKVDEEEFSKHI